MCVIGKDKYEILFFQIMKTTKCLTTYRDQNIFLIQCVLYTVLTNLVF